MISRFRIVQIVVAICVLMPAPFVFMGMVKEAQFTFGFSLITIFNLQREHLLEAIKENIESLDLRFNIWLALMICQVAFCVNASISLYESARPGIAMCLAAILVSHILIVMKKESLNSGE